MGVDERGKKIKRGTFSDEREEYEAPIESLYCFFTEIYEFNA